MYKINNLDKYLSERILTTFGEHDEVDYTKINLQKEYDHLNRLLFNDELPTVKLKWDKKKGAAGHVRHVRNRMTGAVTIQHLSISVFRRTTYREFLDVLAHEMIHVHNIVNSLQEKMFDAHGTYFIKEMNRINSSGYGFNVTITKDSHALSGVSSHVKLNKPLIICLFTMSGKSNIIVMSQNTWLSQAEVLENAFTGWVKRGKTDKVEYAFIKSYDANLKMYKVQTSFTRKVSWNSIDADKWREYRQGDVLKQDSIDRNNIPDEEIKQAQQQTVDFAYMKKEKRRLTKQLRDGRISSTQWKEGMLAAGWKFK